MNLNWPKFRAAASRWSEHNAPRLGAALAYYTIFSLAPLLVIVVAICGFAFGEKAVQGQIFWQIRNLVGDDGAQFVQTVLKTAHRPGAGIEASIIGFAVLLIGASGVFVELRDTLNYIWSAPPSTHTGIWGLLRYRFISFGMILGIGFLLMVSLVLSALVQAAGDYSGHFIAWPKPVMETINFAVSLLTTSVLFALMYRFIPEVRVDWKDVGVGAVLTAVLFTIGKFLIALYLGKASVGSAYGAAGSAMIMLFWVYYSAQIFLYGAELTRVFADSRVASGAKPANEVTVAG